MYDFFKYVYRYKIISFWMNTGVVFFFNRSINSETTSSESIPPMILWQTHLNLSKFYKAFQQNREKCTYGHKTVKCLKNKETMIIHVS